MALGQRMNFKDMTKDELVALLTKVRHSLIDCEDAGDAVMYVSKVLSVNPEVGATNEEEVS